MKFLKRINLLVLITFFMSLVPVTPVFAMQTAGNGTLGAQFEGAATILKDIYTLKYLDGANGQHRDATILEKITNHPERALATAAIYGLTLFAAKKLYDFAEKRGIFSRIFDDLLNQPERPARPRNPQPVVGPAPHAQPVNHVQPAPQVYPAPRVQPVNRPRNNRPGPRRGNRPQQRPNNQQRPAPQPAPQAVPQPQNRRQDGVRQNNVRIANPLPGQQLHLNGMPNNLPGFYHMRSATPYQGVRESCGINAAYNMALVEAQAAGRHVDNNAFNNALDNTVINRRIHIAGQPRNQGNHQVLRDMLGRRGFSNNEIAGLARNFGLAPMVVLVNPRALGPNAFNGAQGPQVAHFLCNVPGHWIAISVVRHVDGTQAMYLYDNLNGAARSVPEMRAYVEAIYNRFF